MPDLRTPGVYVTELNAPTASVIPVDSAIPAFIGRTTTAHRPDGQDLTGIPTRIASMSDFEETFGAAPVHDAGAAAGAWMILPHAMRHYFDNGGGPCYIHSLGALGGASAPEWVAAIAALEAVADVTLLVFPGATALGAAEYASVVNAALASAHRTKGRFVVADVPDAVPGGLDTIAAVDAEFRARLTTDPALLQFGAAYFPFLHTTIPWQAAPGQIAPGGYVLLPPSAAVTGAMVATDRARGVWQAPANVALVSVAAPSVAVSNTEQQAFNVDAVSGKSINVIRAFPGRGTLVWGARTLAGNDQDFRYVNARRTVSYLESSIQVALQAFVFEANDRSTWTRVQAMVENFLYTTWRAGGLVGSTPKDAFGVRVGIGNSMTAQDVLDGIMRVQVFVAMLRPAEFLVIDLVQKMAA